MAREILYKSFDARQVPALLASPSGGIAEAVVIRSEIDELLSQINQVIANTQNSLETADTNLQSTDADLYAQLNALRSGITGRVTVAGVYSDTAASASGVNVFGVDRAAGPSNRASWFLLLSPNPAESGLYYQLPDRSINRVEGYRLASEIPAGLQVYVDSTNQHYVSKDNAAPVSDTNPAVGAVEFIPWSRAEVLQANSPIERVANALNLRFDTAAFEVNSSGQLALSAELLQELQDTNISVGNNRTAIADLTLLINSINDLALQHTQELADYGARIQTNELQLITDGSLIAENQAATDALDGRVTSAETRLDTAEGEITSAQAAITDAQATIVAHSGQLSTLNTTTATNTAAINSLWKSFTLTGGSVAQRIDTDDNQTYFFTTYEISTGWGHLDFRAFDLSDSVAPFTKQGYNHVFQRFGTDSFRIIFQSRLARFPDNQVQVSLIQQPNRNP